MNNDSEQSNCKVPACASSSSTRQGSISSCDCETEGRYYRIWNVWHVMQVWYYWKDETVRLGYKKKINYSNWNDLPRIWYKNVTYYTVLEAPMLKTDDRHPAIGNTFIFSFVPHPMKAIIVRHTYELRLPALIETNRPTGSFTLWF